MQISKKLLVPAPALRGLSQLDNSSLHHVIRTSRVVGTAFGCGDGRVGKN